MRLRSVTAQQCSGGIRMTNNFTLIDLPTIIDQRGNLTYVQKSELIPFSISRVYYLHGVPKNGERGGHAHRELEQVIVAASGCFSVRLYDGYNWTSVKLHSPSEGLLLRNLVWRELSDFSSNSVCLVMASKSYDESDYIRCISEFEGLVRLNDKV